MDENDDIRLIIKLSGGSRFMLTGEQRFYITNGVLVIQDLVEIPAMEQELEP